MPAMRTFSPSRSSFTTGGPVTSPQTMTRPESSGGYVHPGTQGLEGADLTTYRTLQDHDKLKGTNCASAYLALINTAKVQYEDDMRVAGLLSNKAPSYVPGLKMPSQRSLAKTAAKATMATAKAAALKFAADCMRGKVSPGEEQGAAGAIAESLIDLDLGPGKKLGVKGRKRRAAAGVAAQGAAQAAAQVAAQVAAAVAAEEAEDEFIPPGTPWEAEEEPSLLIGEGDDEVLRQALEMQQQQQQAAMDAAVATQAESEEADARNRLILYAVLGLGAAGAAYFFISRRKA